MTSIFIGLKERVGGCGMRTWLSVYECEPPYVLVSLMSLESYQNPQRQWEHGHVAETYQIIAQTVEKIMSDT